MKILISACLLGENCKYNGANNRHEGIIALLAGHEVVAVCPEELGGLGTPREPMERRGERVVTRAGEDKSAPMNAGAEAALRIALEAGVQGAILKSKSPSCGVRQIYDGSFSGRLVAGQGVFAQRLIEAGIGWVVDSEEEIPLATLIKQL